MATKQNDTEDFQDTGDGFDDVETESRIVFDTIGDEFIGVYNGTTLTPTGIPQAHFSNSDGEFFTNAGYDLNQKLQKCRTGRLTRIRLTDTLPIEGRETPMNVFQVGQKSA